MKRGDLFRSLIISGGLVLLVGLIFVSFCAADSTFIVTEMDRNSGKRRVVKELWGVRLSERTVDPLWISEFAAESEPDWVPVMGSKPRVRINFTWGGVHANIQVIGSCFETEPVPSEIRRAIGQEVLRLISEHNSVYEISRLLNDAGFEILFDRPDRGDSTTPEDVRAIFGRLEQAGLVEAGGGAGAAEAVGVDRGGCRGGGDGAGGGD